MRMKMGQDTQAKTQCPNCHQIAHWTILRVLRFFTLFFIPLIPYRMQYFMICPSCDAAVKIKGADAKARVANDGTLGTDASTPRAHVDRSFDEQETHRTSAIRHESFLLPSEQIVQIEKKIMRKGNLILAGLGALLIFLWLRDAMQYWITLLLAVICILGLAITILQQHVQMRRWKSKLPQKILFGSGDLWIDNQCFNISRIKAAAITSMKIRGNSLRPKQRFLTIQTDTETKRYWLGSSSSLHDSTYAALSTMLTRGLNEHGVTLTHSMKKTVQDHLDSISF